MKERPILFSTDMIRAILDVRKTQTRRIVKVQPTKEYFKIFRDKETLKYFFGHYENHLLQEKDNVKFKNPYGFKEDVLWVRESFKDTDDIGFVPDENTPRYLYKADDNMNEWKGWSPSIHMPKTACRIHLQITDIRVERLLDISECDAIAEGVKQRFGGYINYVNPNKILSESYPYLSRKYSPAQMSFLSLWEKINGENSITANPFVWVIEFKRIQQ